MAGEASRNVAFMLQRANGRGWKRTADDNMPSASAQREPEARIYARWRSRNAVSLATFPTPSIRALKHKCHVPARLARHGNLLTVISYVTPPFLFLNPRLSA